MNEEPPESATHASSSRARFRRMLIGRRPRATLLRAALIGVGCYIVFRFAFLPVYVNGESMAPTYNDRTFNFANVLLYRIRDPEPGEIVVIEMTGQRAMYLKRILAGPGDEVYFRDGVLIVNDEIIPEPYVIKHGNWSTAPEQLDAFEYYVAGDNRTGPWQSHVMGVVNRTQIAGRIVL